MNHRLTVTSAVAVVLASVSLIAVIQGVGWLYGGIGAVTAVAVAGTLNRLATGPATAAAVGLALIACLPLLTGGGWYWKLAGLLIIAAAAAGATRLRVFRAVSGLITYLAALLIYLNAVFASAHSALAVLPGQASMHHLWLLANQGLAQKHFAPPVQDIRGVLLLAAGGIGLMAVITDVIAVRLRSPAIAGLPLLVLFSVPIATTAQQTSLGAAVAFALGITGYLALLAADGRERLRIWGRLVTVWPSGDDDEQVRGPDTRALAAGGRRIGLAAVSLAIVVPLVLPAMSTHGIFGKHAVPGGGGPAVTLPDPIARMKAQLLLPRPQTVLTYRTNNPDPQAQYLPVYVLDYDGSSGTFKIVAPTAGASVQVTDRPLLRAPGLDTRLIETPRYRTTVTIGALTSGLGSKLSFLPLPYAPVTLRVGGGWQEDDATLAVYSGQQGLPGLRYAVTSAEPDPASPSELNSSLPYPASVVNGYLGFSARERSALRKIALRVTKGATTPYQKAVALEDWFTTPGRFTYSLTTTVPDGPAGLLRFLQTNRQGFCQQFAYGMAVLARLVGIPSRIAEGYTAGTRQRDGTWKVTTADAHDWPELYFGNAGWLRFEPTPGGPTGQGTATPPPYARSTGGPGSTGTSAQRAGAGGTAPRPGRRAGGSSRFGPHPNITAGNLPGAGTASGGSGIVLLVLLIAALVLALAASTPLTARLVTRRRRWMKARGPAGLAHAAWREFRDDLDDYGLTCQASETPRAVARRVALAGKLEEPARQALSRIVRAEERASYAVAPEPGESLGADVLAVRHAISRKATRGARWRALLFPASTLRPVRGALQQALDVFGWLEVASQRVRSQVGHDTAARGAA